MSRPNWWVVACLAVLVLILAREARAEPMTEAAIVQAVIGEAEGEGAAGMEAVAFAIVNRGTLKGVYGYRAIKARGGRLYRGTRPIAPTTLKTARNAVKRAIKGGVSPVGRAKHWENVRAFGVPYWAKGKTPVAVIGSHAFYEGIR